MRFGTCLLMIVLAAPALLAQSTIEDRLSKLEDEMKALRAENEALRKQIAAAPQAAASTQAEPGKQAGARVAAPQAMPHEVKPGGKEPRLQVGGLFQVQGEGGGRPDSRFTDAHDRVFLRRMRLNAVGKFDESVDFKVEFDAAGSLSNSSGMRALLTDAYLNWTQSPSLYVRAGQFKTPFGFEQLYSDSFLPAVERTLGNDRIAASRQLGVLVGGTGAGKRLTYAVGAFNGTGTNSNFNDDDGFMVAGRVTGVVLQKPKSTDSLLSVGLNSFRTKDSNVSLSSDYGFDSTPSSSARDNIFAGRRNAIGADAQVNLGRVELWTEMLRSHFEPGSSMPFHTFDAKAWYVLGAFPLVGNRLQGVVRYDAFDPNTSVARDDTRSWLVGTSYFIRGHDLKLQLFYLDSNWAGHRSGRVIARFQTIF